MPTSNPSPTKRPHILISNDDGVHAPGIKHLCQALIPHADLTVVAPSGEQSAVGLSVTIRQPLRIEKVKWHDYQDGDVWSVSGTPVDSVKMALNVILKQRPDLVVTGINRGTNAGRNVLYSGTVAAAIESIMQQIPSVAFSCQDYYEEPDYKLAGQYVPYIVAHVLKYPLPAGTLLNVNFPARAAGKIKGFKMTSQGSEWWAENPDKRTHPAEGHDYYWLGSQLKWDETEQDGDGAWLRRGYITAVPVHVADLTDRNHLKAFSEHFDESFPT